MIYNHAKHTRKLQNGALEVKHMDDVGIPEIDKDRGRTGRAFNYRQWRQAQEKDAEGGDSFRFYKTALNIGSELRTHLDGTDLLLECRFTLPNCKQHLRSDGITNFLYHVIQSLSKKAADQLVEMMIERSGGQDKSEDTPILF